MQEMYYVPTSITTISFFPEEEAGGAPRGRGMHHSFLQEKKGGVHQEEENIHLTAKRGLRPNPNLQEREGKSR